MRKTWTGADALWLVQHDIEPPPEAVEQTRALMRSITDGAKAVAAAFRRMGQAIMRFAKRIREHLGRLLRTKQARRRVLGTPTPRVLPPQKLGPPINTRGYPAPRVLHRRR